MTQTGAGRVWTRRGLAAVVLGSSLMWACEGSHLFAPFAVGPEIAALEVPAEIESGETITVSVRAVAQIRVDSIVSTLRIGSYEETQIALQTGISSDFSATLDFSIPATVSDTVGTLEAYAVDAQSNVGRTAAVNLRAIDTAPPTVALSLGTPQIGVGAELNVGVSAADNVGLSRIGFQINALNGGLLAELLVDQTGRTVDRTLAYLVPGDLPLGDVVVVGVAVDHQGNIGTGLPLPATLTDVEIPEIEILAPLPGAEEPAQNPLFVQVRLRDNDQIQAVRLDGVAHRGDPTLGTDQVVTRFVSTLVSFSQAVSDTILQRNLAPATDSTSENVFIRVEAFDREGNVTRDSVEISLLADELDPVAEIVTPTDGSARAVGDSILVETFIEKLPAAFRTGIRTLRLEGVAFRGDPELGTLQVVPRYLTRTVTLDPPVFDRQLIRRYLLVAAPDPTAEPVYIIATAIDEWGNQGADTVRVDLVPDSIPPNVQISAPANGSSRAAGDSILVQATGSEPVGVPNQRGIAAMIVDGVAYRPAQVLKYQEERVEFSPSQASAFMSVWIKPTADLTVEGVWIRVTAEDAAGNTTTDSVMVNLTPPPPTPPPARIGHLPADFDGGGDPADGESSDSKPLQESPMTPAGRDGRSDAARRRRRPPRTTVRWKDPPRRPSPGEDSHPARAGFFRSPSGVGS